MNNVEYDVEVPPVVLERRLEGPKDRLYSKMACYNFASGIAGFSIYSLVQLIQDDIRIYPVSAAYNLGMLVAAAGLVAIGRGLGKGGIESRVQDNVKSQEETK